MESQGGADAPRAIDEPVPVPGFPRWQMWRGVAGLLYARRPKTSPPKVVRATNLEELKTRIKKAEAA